MAPEIRLRLYEELNDFLPPDKRKSRFAYSFRDATSVAQLLEDLAIPQGRVELVLVNGDSAGFSHRLEDGDFVSIYPVFELLDVEELLRARAEPLRRTRFLAGANLSRLAGYLRRLGFDTLDSRFWELKKVVRVSEQEQRILLTRNPSLLKCREFSRIYLVRGARPRDQLLEVLRRFDLLVALRSRGRSGLARVLKSGDVQ